jgi:hypothetical protein
MTRNASPAHRVGVMDAARARPAPATAFSLSQAALGAIRNFNPRASQRGAEGLSTLQQARAGSGENATSPRPCAATPMRHHADPRPAVAGALGSPRRASLGATSRVPPWRGRGILRGPAGAVPESRSSVAVARTLNSTMSSRAAALACAAAGLADRRRQSPTAARPTQNQALRAARPFRGHCLLVKESLNARAMRWAEPSNQPRLPAAI